jgi:hypothetical protein
VRLLTAGGEDLTDSTDPTRIMMRQIAGAFAEYEKRRLVAKLKSGRERKRAETGLSEGRLPRIRTLAKAGDQGAVERLEAAIAMALRLRRANPVAVRSSGLAQTKYKFCSWFRCKRGSADALIEARLTVRGCTNAASGRTLRTQHQAVFATPLGLHQPVITFAAPV